jgi:hypothetical protein
MKTLITAIVVCLLLGSTAYGGWYVAPTRVRAYYPVAPVYAYPAPMVAPVPYAVYSPVVVPAPVWVAPPGVVVRGKVYLPGRPVRNTVRAVLP